MKVLIINFNRLTLPKKLADWVAAHGCEPVFVDNHSDYPPLLEYYRNCPYSVLKLTANYGHSVIWQFPVLKELKIEERFIMTDPDLDLTGVPDDFVAVMNEGLDRYPQYSKCGLSLEINDLPDSEEGRFIGGPFGPEQLYWTKPLDEMYFHADTDTTFALYRYPLGPFSHSAIRTNRPYTARHLPWYYTDFNLLPEDEQYYYRTAGRSCSHKERFMR